MSFQAVAGTTTDGTAVANAAVGTFNALGMSTNNTATNAARMNKLFDVMDQTVRLGNMQWSAYKNVVSKLAVAIQGTSVKFNESQAALALLTNEGFSAQKASTYLANTFTTLAIKTDAIAKHAKALGISFDESKYGPMSLADKISYLNKITDGNKQKLLALMGNNATALRTFNALSAGLNIYKDNLKSLNNAQGALKQSFDKASQGAQFQQQQFQALGESIEITVGSKILPILTKIGGKIMPIVKSFADWIQKSGVLDDVANGLSRTIDGVSNAVSTVVGWFGSLSSKGLDLKAGFQLLSSQGAGMARDTFHDLARAAQTVSTWFNTTMLPAIKQAMPGFRSLAGALAQNLIPNIRSTFNYAKQLVEAFLSIYFAIESNLAPIVIKIAGMLADKLGKAIQILSPYFRQAQGAIGQFAGEIASRVQPIISQFFKQISDGLDAFQKLWNEFWPFLAPIVKQQFAIVIGFIQTSFATISGIIKIALDLISGNWKGAFSDWKDMVHGQMDGLVTMFKGPINQILAQFGLLRKGGVQNVSDLTKNIQSIVSGAVAWLGNAWHTAFTTVVGWFSWLYNHNYYFKDLVDFINKTTQQITSWLTDKWSQVTSWLVGKWASLKGFATSAWQAVSSVFSSAWSSYIAGPLQSLWNNISTWFTGLNGKASGFGSNFLQGWISGFTSQLGNLAKAAEGAAHTVSQFLGFHSPAEKGPGRELNQWPVNFVKSYAAGLNNSKPVLTSAVNNLAAALAGMKTSAKSSGSASLNAQITAKQKQIDAIKALIKALEAAHKGHRHTKAQEAYYKQALANDKAKLKLLDKQEKELEKKRKAGLGSVSASGGASSSSLIGGSSSSSTGGSSSSSTVVNNFTFNNSFTIQVPNTTSSSRQFAREICDIVDRELGRRMRVKGPVPPTSGNIG